MWTLIVILNVQFALHHNMDTTQSVRYRTEQECEHAKERMLKAYPDAVDAAWCE